MKKRIAAKLNKEPGCKCECRPAGSRTGEADIFGCFCGQHFELEVKTVGGRTSPGRAKIQMYRRGQWRGVGAIAEQVTSFEEAMRVLTEAVEP